MFPVKNRKATQTKQGTSYNTKLQKFRLTWENDHSQSKFAGYHHRYIN